MELSKKALYIIAAVLFLLGGLLGIITGVFFVKGEPFVTNVIGRDTLVTTKVVTRTDTIVKEVEHRTVKFDTVWLNTRDTVFVTVPLSSSHFSGIDYDIWATGYRTSIDSVKVSAQTLTKEVFITQKADYANTMNVSLEVGTLFYNDNKLPYTGINATWDKGRMQTGVSFGLLYQSGANFYFNTGWRWNFLQRKF